MLQERRIAFEYPDDLDPAWIAGLPELACAANSVSLLMPYAEPYFIRSARAALDDLEPDLRARTEAYIRQEAGHYRQHQRFNDLVRARYPTLAILEGWMRRCCTWLSDTRTRRFNLAFAAGAETIAFCLARWTERHSRRLFTGAEPVPTTLFLWHLAEEVEHKTAAFDAYEAIDGSRLRYAVAMVMSLVLLGLFTGVGTMIMLVGEHRAFHPVAWFRLLRLAVSLAFELFPTMLVSALPGHHPSDLADPVLLPTWLGQYDPATGTMPLWSVSR